jgi:DNA adenine methylase
MPVKTRKKAARQGKRAASPKPCHGLQKYALGQNATVVKAEQRSASAIYLEQAALFDNVTVLPRKRGTKRIVFGWYGGKFSHLDWLLPLLPKAHHYCEPFSGSAAVLLNREPSAVETYNDIDGDVVNFFRMLRDRSEELVRAIALTPFSREEFHLAVKADHGVNDLERARHFYIRARQARTGLAQTATLGRWANCKNTSRAGMSGVVSRWLGGLGALDDIATRLLRVQIENRPATDLIRLYDDQNTLFYCDPPYMHETRGDAKAYGFEMTTDQHWALVETLEQCKGKAAVSGYRCDAMDTWYKSWRRYDAPAKMIHSTKQLRHECLWMNY